MSFFSSSQLRALVEDRAVVEIPWRLVRPFKGQPREHFDKAKLNALKESIAQSGQETPGKVRVLWGGVDQQFELVDGERRLRAVSLLDRPFRALVEDIDDPEVQFEKAVRANLNRADHTALEIARAVERIRNSKRVAKLPKGEQIAAVGRMFGRSDKWVLQYLGLARLDPTLRRMLEPGVKKRERLPLTLAFRLSSLPRDEQMIAYKRISKRKLGALRAQRLIDRTIMQKGLHKHRRGRKPSDEFAIVKKFSDKVQSDAGLILDMTDAQLVRAVTSREEKARAALLQDLAMAAQAVDRIRQRVRVACKQAVAL